MKLKDSVRYESMPSMKKDHWKLVDFERKRGFEAYPSPAIGIEVEVENARDMGLSSPFWRVDSDGSLRNGGLEWISSPTLPENVECLVKQLYDALPSSAHFSPRTSVHVHMNCRELTFMQVFNIVLVYQVFEDLLYEYAGRERKKSIFCVPLGNTQYYKILRKHCDAGALIHWSKYTGLNLAPLGNYGTIEFRHLRGTSDREVVYRWLHMLYRLYNYAISIDTKELEAKLLRASEYQSGYELGFEVFRDMFPHLACDSYAKKIDEDLSIAKLFMLSE